MVKSNFVQLGEVSEAIRGVTFSGGEAVPDAFENGLACLTTSGVQEVVNWDSRRFIPRDRLASPKQLLREGDILISTANSKELVGKSCLVDRLPYEATFGAFVTVIRPNKKVSPEYLAFWMKTKEFLDKCYLMSSNTTNISNLRTSELLEFQIPLPPLTEQKRIASLLARADRLRQLRRTARQLADSLLQSVFLEMFGDPRTNPQKWDLFELGEVVEINPPGRPKANADQPTSFLPMTLVDPSHIYSDILDVKRFDEVSKGYTYFEENDVLFAKITPCMENGNIVIARNLLNGFGFGSTEFHVVRPNEKANAAWLYGFVKRPEFREEATRWFRGTAGQQRVPSDFLESYRVPLPPLPLQEEFAGMVARVESLRGRMSEAGRQVEGLFESLLHEAFNG
jgi:type I restriction enzyme S subunit